MTSALVYGLTGSMLIAIGFYGFLAQRHFLRQILSFNVAGSGVFLLFGALSARAPEHASDPVPQAMIITGIVVALSATALALALLRRLRDGARSLPDAGDEDG